MQKTIKLKGYKEICDYLRIGQKTFYDLLQAGLPVCLLGNAYRADAMQIDAWYSDFVKSERDKNGKTQA
jgi:hypothetical protein